MWAAVNELASGVVGGHGFGGCVCGWGDYFEALLPLLVGVGHRDGADEELSVGMFGLLDDGDYISLLGDDASIKDYDLFADLVGGGEVVSDVDDGDAELSVELSEVFEDGGTK